MLLGRDKERFRIGSALFWACAWGLGAAIGVALGGWLTLVGGSGAPGGEALQPLTDLGLLPAGAFALVVLLHLGGQLVAASLRGRAERGRQHEGDDEGTEDDGITG